MQVKKRCWRESISELHMGQRRSSEGMRRREEILVLVWMMFQAIFQGISFKFVWEVELSNSTPTEAGKRGGRRRVVG
jgi:hypothetical protein